MYHGDAGPGPKELKALKALRAPVLAPGTRPRVTRTVVLLGTVSMLTDISSEMVASVLPIYLFTVLRLSPLEFGVVDGLFNGSAALVRLIFAHWADRTRQHKRIAFLGYALSALSRLGLFIAGLGGWISVAIVLLLDRIGKGIRTAPRDAMIAQASDPASVGAAFGVHRALDAVGALIGPLIATALLLAWPGRFDAVFAVSVVFALAGLYVLGRWVRVPAANAVNAVDAQGAAGAAAPEPSANAGAPAGSFLAGLATNLRTVMTVPFVALCLCCTLLATFTVSDNMLYLGVQANAGFNAAYLPMMFVATAGVFMLLAVPMGRLADRIGPWRLFVMAHGGLGVLYAVVGLHAVPVAWSPWVTVLLLGSYYAATEGVVMALLARKLPAEVRATGMAVVTSLIALARMVASVAFGWVWTERSHEVALGIFAAGLVLSLLLTAWVMRRWGDAVAAQPR